MEATGQIYTAIAAIMAEVPAIGKNKHNQQQGFKFRGIDDVYNNVQPLFAKHGVFPVVQQREMMHRVEGQTRSGGTMYRMTALYDVRFYAKDGSFVTVTLEAEGMDSADKGTNKCHSVAHKYALLTLLMIPTEDMAEPDAHTPEPATFPAQQPKQAPPATRPPSLVTEAQITKIHAMGNQAYPQTWDEVREKVVDFSTNGRVKSVKDLTADEASSLIDRLDRKIKGV